MADVQSSKHPRSSSRRLPSTSDSIFGAESVRVFALDVKVRRQLQPISNGRSDLAELSSRSSRGITCQY
jgi:hypothetical protein